jgi:hypothetical protein
VQLHIVDAPLGAGPESISPNILAAQWIPGLVLTHHPGMTAWKHGQIHIGQYY